MSLYTRAVEEILHTARAPHRGLVMDIEEWPDTLKLVVYSDNLSDFPRPVQEDFAVFLIDLVKRLQQVTTIHLEKKAYVPTSRRVS